MDNKLTRNAKKFDKDLFRNPSSDYRMASFWAWNDGMTEEQISIQLRLLHENGFGGAFVHPRPGLVNEYLSEEWFSLWRIALEQARELGMKLYIYDENSYPSGFAGGHVPAQHPENAARAISLRFVDDEASPESLYRPAYDADFPQRPVKIYACVRESAGNAAVGLGADLTEVPDEEWRMYGSSFAILEWEKPDHSPWLGGFAYPDLLREETAQLFLQTTYEPYFEKFGKDFGGVIPAIFTDEPAIAPGGVFLEPLNRLPFSYRLAEEFEARNGYSLIDNMILLFLDSGDGGLPGQGIPAEKVRFDYYCTVRELWVERFIRPVSEWCEHRGIAWTGHYMEHLWPYPWGQCSPSVMSLYEYMQWPAIDMLLTRMLKKNGTDPLMVTVKEVQSAANQFGKSRVLCESFGAGGWDASFDDFKRIGDWLAVHGIDFFTPHLTFSTIVGARKRDHPQSFDWRQPWWKEFKVLVDYFGRLSYAMASGCSENRILVLHPTTSWFLDSPLNAQGNLLWEWDHVPEGDPFRTYIDFLEELNARQLDYDLGDEFILERHGEVAKNKLRVSRCTYDAVVVPAEMRHMKSSTLKLLEQFAHAGGRVLVAGDPIHWIDGMKSNAPLGGLVAGAGLVKFATTEALYDCLRDVIPPRLEWQGADVAPGGVAHLARKLDQGTTLFLLTNGGPKVVEGTILFEGHTAEILDLFSGETVPLESHRIDNGRRLMANLRIEPSGSTLLLVRNEVAEEEAAEGSDGQTANSVDSSTPYGVETLAAPIVAPEEPNAWTLDYCDLELGGRTYTDIHALAACELIYRRHGFYRNPWDRTIQYKRAYLDRAEFAFDSGFAATFFFSVEAGGVPDSLQLAVERGTSYRLFVNGHPMAWSSDRHLLDHHLTTAEIGGYMQEGRNEIRLEACPFHLLLELEPIYLFGDFQLGICGDVFQMQAVEKHPLSLGSLAKQGYPFYGGGIRYRYLVNASLEIGQTTLRMKGWNGTVCKVECNGHTVGLIGIGNGQELDLSSWLSDGENELDIVIIGSLKNVLGPHHDADIPRNSAWPIMWKKAPRYGPPPAERFDFIDYGMLESPELLRRKR